MLNLNAATRLGLNILLLLGAVIALKLGQSVFIPTIIALLLAAVLGPAALWLHQRLKIRWTLACVTAVSILIILNLVVTMVFALAIPRMLQVLPRPDDEKSMLKLYKNFREQIDSFWPFEVDSDLFPPYSQNLKINQIQVFQNLADFARNVAPDVLKTLLWYGTSWLWQWILILFILFFLLLEGGMLTRRVVEIFGPSDEVQNKARSVLFAMAGQVKTYLVWRTIINFGLALVVGSVYHVAGLSQPWTWAILLAILNYVPYLGPLVAGAPPIIDAFLSVSPYGALFVLLFYVAIIIFEGYIIVPVLMGRSMDLNATTVMLACLFWELIWGTLGLFLAMPLMAAIKATCYHVPGWRPWANLMSSGEEEPQPVFLKKDVSTPALADPGSNGQDKLPLPAEEQVKT